MKLYRVRQGNLLEWEDNYYLLSQPWDELINREGLHDHLRSLAARSEAVTTAGTMLEEGVLPPIGSQEVWGAGVTYLRSRNARMEESKASGGADFYDKVYEADRPELFFKS